MYVVVVVVVVTFFFAIITIIITIMIIIIIIHPLSVCKRRVTLLMTKSRRHDSVTGFKITHDVVKIMMIVIIVVVNIVLHVEFTAMTRKVRRST